MYRWIVKRIVLRTFARLNAGDVEALVRQFAPDARFVFAGTHALSGERRGPDGVRAWFREALELFPGLRIEPQTVVVSGWPWNTRFATHFVVTSRTRDGRAYRNEGMQIVRLRWGRVVEDRI